MTTTAFAAHRLVSSLPLTSLPDLVGSASFAAPCLDDHGRDLVFSALRNPEWKTARSQKQPAQNALLQWLDRRDVDPFAPQLLVNPNAKAKKGAAPTKAYATSFQLAMDMGLESLAVGMLSCAAVTPARLEVLRSSELGQDLLEKALAKNMTALMAKAAESGWDLLRRDAQGRSLLWQARSLEAVNALLEAGLPVDRLAEPGVLEALGKSLPRKDAQPWLSLDDLVLEGDSRSVLLKEVIADPQLQANDIVVPLEGAGGTLTSTINSPIKSLTGVTARMPPNSG